MTSLGRRSFLKAGVAAAGAVAAPRFIASAWAQPVGANGAIRVAVVGLNQKGAQHVVEAAKVPGVRIAALCDVDPRILAREVEALKPSGARVRATTDFRELLSWPDIDAVILATSNHWHALQTIWACQAGRDVYVEKPVCHTVWEGRMMVAAAARHRRIIQTGTQSRSDPGLIDAVRYVQEGHLGRLQWIHAVTFRRRDSIGRRPPWYPDWLDYNLYCGPAAMKPLRRNALHYDWHWVWSTGDGDLANVGVHYMDIARWFAGDPPFPSRILSFGGRFARDDAGETPNSQLAVYDADVPIFLETRGLTAEPGVRYMDNVRGVRRGVIVQCEHGYYAGHIGGAIYDNDGKRMKVLPGDGGGSHLANFFAAVRSRRAHDLAAPIETGFASSACSLLGNVSCRVGRPARPEEIATVLERFPPAGRILENMREHLARHGIDLEKTPHALGPWLEIDAASGEILGLEPASDDRLELARALWKGTHRPPFVFPPEV